MEFCKKCGAPVDDGQTLCSACQAAQDAENAENAAVTTPETEPETAAPAEPEAPEAESPEEPEASGEPEAPEGKKPVTEKQRRQRTQILMAGVLLIAAIAVCVVVYLTKGRPSAEPTDDPVLSDETKDALDQTQPSDTADTDTDAEPVSFPSYTKDPSEVTDAEKLAVVATCAGEELTNQSFAYYYWYSYSSFINSYYTYVYYYGLLDTTAPLNEQTCYFDNTISWQQYFVDNAMNAFAQFTLLAQQASAAGFTLPDDTQAELDGLYDTLKASADEGGFASVDAYLQEYYGAFADFDSYHAFMEKYYTALHYDDSIYNSFVYTDDEVSAYYDEHADEIDADKDDSLMVDVRHILIQPETVEDVTDADGNVDEAATEQAKAEAKAAAKQKAEELYEQWKSGEATEESFSELAYNNSSDTGSYSKGGLYEDVYPGEMVAEFDAWCFDPARQPGDTAVVETDYGYHIMYFVGYGETSHWRAVTQEAMVQAAYDSFFDGLMAGDDSVTDTDKVVLLDPPGLYSADEQTEQAGEELLDEADESVEQPEDGQ